jgi:hypothetical protein
MNTVQRAYAKAKTLYEIAVDLMNRLEADFLANHGRSEKHVWCILDDESVFNRLNNEFSETFEYEAAVLFKAQDDLRKAENALIAYGLSIIPKKYADILRSTQDITVRQEIIELAFKLDTRTVPKHIA